MAFGIPHDDWGDIFTLGDHDDGPETINCIKCDRQGKTNDMDLMGFIKKDGKVYYGAICIDCYNAS